MGAAFTSRWLSMQKISQRTPLGAGEHTSLSEAYCVSSCMCKILVRFMVFWESLRGILWGSPIKRQMENIAH